MYRARPSLVAAVAACALACLAVPAEAGRTFVEVGSGRGLAATVVPSMLVDHEGLLWVGSREGLYRYDGYLATAFRPVPGDPHSLSDIDVRAVYEGRDGTLWVSTNTAGLNRLDRRTGRFTRYGHDSADPGSLSDPSVYGVAEDARGRIWAGSQRGLNRLDAKTGRFTRFFHEPGRAGSLANDWVYALHVGASGTLWIGTVGGGIDRWDEVQGRFVNLRPSTLTGGDATLDDIFALHEGPDGRLWAGTRGGLVVIEPSTGTGRLVDLRNGDGVQPLVTAMRPDSRGQLWVTSMQHGVMTVDLGRGVAARAEIRFGRKSSNDAPNQPLLSVAAGPHHVFVGTWGAGVFRAPLDEPPFALLATLGDGGLRNLNLTSILGGDDAGRPWVGSFGGGPQRVDVRAGTAEPSPGGDDERLPMSGIVSLARMAGGRMFAGSTEGLFGFDADGRNLRLDRHVPGRDDVIGPGYVAALLPWGRDQLLVGVGGSGLHLRGPDGRFRAHRHDPARRDSLSGDYVTALAPGPAGQAWVGTRSNGLNLCRVEPFSCRRLPSDAAGGTGIAHHHVTSLRTGPAGELWVATDGGGLHRIDSSSGAVDTIRRWGAAEGIIDDGIMAVERDDDGSLWLSTRHGLARLDPVSGRVVNHVPESGLPATHFNTGASSSDARFLYFGSVDGLVSLPRGTRLAQRSATPVAITAIEVLGAEDAQRLVHAPLADGFRVRYRDGLAIEFAVLDFAETTHEYAYRMQADADWTSLGPRRQVTFLDLEPGQYRFEIRGRDVFGQWNSSAPVVFEVVPPVWMTTWFRVLAALLLVALAFSLHLGRTRALEARNAVLENLKRQREFALERARASQLELQEAYAGLRQLTARLESAKEDERARISRELHDEFGQTLTAAKITLQMLRRGTGDAAVADGLAQSVAMVDGMIRQARDIARGLRPPLLDEAGLVPALDHHLKTAASRSGVRIDLQSDPGVSSVPRGLDTTVFRLVQEAVSNALRHAGARAIRVELGTGTGALRIVVEDDGVGFDPAVVGQKIKRGEHLGLLGMTERVHGVGGRIDFESRPGGGSRIVVQMPLAPSQAPDAAPETDE